MEKMYQRAIKHWGNKKQLEKAIEELDELIKEIVELINTKDSHKIKILRDKIKSEMADNRNMFGQLQIMLDISDEELQKEMLRKMQRTMKRIDVEVS